MLLSDSLNLLDDDAFTPVSEELLLTDKDFPTNFINKQHPDDYKITNKPIEKELIFHEHLVSPLPRLLLRCSIKLTEGAFCAMTFVLDTNAPKIYVSAPAKHVFMQNKILLTDDDLGLDLLMLLGRKYRVEDTPEGHAPANIIGLKTLCRWGLVLSDEPFGFHFKNDFDYLEVGTIYE